MQNILHPERKKNNNKLINYEIMSYIYIAIVASLVNIMNSVNLSDAVFWYGVSLGFGIKSSIFILVISGLLMVVSAYFSKEDGEKNEKEDLLVKSLQETIIGVKTKQVEVDEIIKDFTKRFSNIASPREVDDKIKEMVDDKIDDVTSDLQRLSDKTAIIAEQLAKIKGGSNLNETSLPSLRKDKYKPSWADDDDEDDDDKFNND